MESSQWENLNHLFCREVSFLTALHCKFRGGGQGMKQTYLYLWYPLNGHSKFCFKYEQFPDLSFFYRRTIMRIWKFHYHKALPFTGYPQLLAGFVFLNLQSAVLYLWAIHFALFFFFHFIGDLFFDVRASITSLVTSNISCNAQYIYIWWRWNVQVI